MPRIRCIRAAPTARRRAIDARTLADLCQYADPPMRQGLKPRGPGPSRVVRTNREHPPDFINIKVEELVGDRPFDDLDKYITQDELRMLSENYKRVAGFALTDVSEQ
jgi:hypothetical protein